MITSTVNAHTENIISISKDGHTAIVVLLDSVVAVTSLRLHPDGIPFIAYTNNLMETESAVEKYRHIIAKLICKDSHSKYFGCPRYDEHFSNGDTTFVNYEWLVGQLSGIIYRVSDELGCGVWC